MDTFKQSGNKEIAVLIFIILLGLGTRFINIDAHSIYIDETWVVPTTNFHFGEDSIYPKLFKYPEYQTLSPKIKNLVRTIYDLHPIFQVTAIRAASDVHPPFFFILNYYWSEWFGYDLATVRTPAAVYFIITLIVLFFFLKNQNYRLSTRLMLLGLIIVTPYYLFFSNFARPYTLLLLLCLITSCLSYYLVKYNFEKYKVLYIVSALLCMYTHYFGGIVIASQAVYMVMESYIAGSLRNNITKIIIIELIIGLLFLPWFFVLILQMKTKFPRLEGNAAFVYFDFGALRDLILFFTPANSRGSVYSYLNWFLGTLQIIMAVMGFKYLIKKRDRQSSRFWMFFLVCPFILIIVFNTITPVFTVRNCAIVLIPYLIVCGIGIASIRHRISRGVVISLLLVPGLYYTLYGVSVGDANAGLTIESWKKTAEYIQTIEPCPPVYVYHPSYRDGLYYYIKDMEKIRGFSEDRVETGPEENEIILVFVNHREDTIEEKLSKDLPFITKEDAYKVTLLRQIAQTYIYDVRRY